jgi:hypothetical protein
MESVAGFSTAKSRLCGLAVARLVRTFASMSRLPSLCLLAAWSAEEARASLWWALGGLGCTGAAGLLLLWLAAKLLRRASESEAGEGGMPPGAAMPPPGPRREGGLPRVRITEEGFWLEGGTLAPGTVLTCSYRAGGAAQSVAVRFAASAEGQFIATGGRPAGVSVAITGAAQ